MANSVGTKMFALVSPRSAATEKMHPRRSSSMFSVSELSSGVSDLAFSSAGVSIRVGNADMGV